MIYAEANYTQDNRVSMVICYPDSQDNKTVTVANESEGRRIVYFHNRQYFKLQLTEWLGQRINALNHAEVVDEDRITLAETLIECINKHSNALHPQCRKIIEKTPLLLKLAPSAQSRHYDKYRSDILPIIQFCHDLQGIPFQA
ncbi:hypothetical protein J3L18_05500 [Mucilaginibacter gossypii]|uniref:hypothetical protein n=1 Tax=Mucilaginibacter gossypii TaxID=551996 RepID=UPI000DCB0C6A|nr:MULTISPECIES: hypothetical protein [Mucilaginibacter]QTE38533.1 hypothetical protein J3L18_05500 [Mucilaginibacter gossypii]RAV55733.1 hypothetical protein DIU36_16715 [Mucilaginibacter rubeus]